MFFFGLYVEHVILQSTSAGNQKFALRMCLLEGCVLPNLQRPSTQKTILCQRRFLIAAQQLFPLCLGHASVLKCVSFLATDRFVLPSFWAVLLVLPRCQGFEVLHDPCLQARQRKQWMANMLQFHTCLMYSHVFSRLDQGHTSWSLCILDAEKSIQLLKVKS